MNLDKPTVILMRRRRALAAPSIERTLTGAAIEFASAAFHPFTIQNEDTDQVFHSGKNMSDVGAFVYPDDGTVCVIFDGLPAGQTYNASAHRDSVTTTGSGIRIRFQYDLGGQTVYDPGSYGSSGWMSKSSSIPVGATNVMVAVQRASAVTAYSISDIQLELGSSRTEYEPFRMIETGRGVKCAIPGKNIVWSEDGTNVVTYRRFGWQED